MQRSPMPGVTQPGASRTHLISGLGPPACVIGASQASAQPRTQLQTVGQLHAFLRLDAAEAPPKSMRVTLNTASFVRRNLQDLTNDSLLGGREQPLSNATVKARRKVERVVLQNLQRQQKKASTNTSTQQQQQGSTAGTATAIQQVQQEQQQVNGKPVDVIMELVLEGNAVADFAGVLTLLLECGQHEEQVIAAGSVLLNARDSAAAKRRAQPGMQDVVLCVALAHAQLALKCMGSEQATLTMGDAGPMLQPLSSMEDVRLVSQPPSAATLEDAYGHITEALRLLKEHGGSATNATAGSASLRQQLLDMLLRVAPLHAGYLLGTLPGDGPAKPANNKARSRAVDVLKSSLWQLEGATQRLELLGQVRPWLTAGEQVALYDDAPVPDTELSEQELYDTALACIWQGYTQRWPHHVYRADTLLGVIAKRPDLDVDVTLERSVCSLLLGKQSEAQGQLVAARAAYTYATSTTDGDEPTSDAEAVMSAAGLKGGKGLGGGKGGGKKLVPQMQQQRSGRAGQDGKRHGGVEQLRLGMEDSAFVVMESSDNAQDDVSALEQWAERWLELAVMPVFSSQQALSGSSGSALASADLPPVSVSVRSYLNSPKVAVFNQVLRYANEQNLRHVTENLESLSHDSLQQLLSLWRSGTSSLAQSTSSLAQTVLRKPQGEKAQEKPLEKLLGAQLQDKAQEQAVQAVQVVQGQVMEERKLQAGADGAVAAPPAGDGKAVAAAVMAVGATAAGNLEAAGAALASDDGSGVVPPGQGKQDTTTYSSFTTSDGSLSSMSPSGGAGGSGGVVVPSVLDEGMGLGSSERDLVVKVPIGSMYGTMASMDMYGSLSSVDGTAGVSTADGPAAASGSMGGAGGGYGVGERSSDGEDTSGLEALPWVQMQKDTAGGGGGKPGRDEERDKELKERTLRARVELGKLMGGTVDHASWSFDEFENADGSGGSLWVLSPEGVLRPRMTARIVDPTNSRNAGGVVPQVPAGGGVQGTLARAVGVTAVLVAIAAGTFAATFGSRGVRVGAAVQAPQPTVVQAQEQEQQQQQQSKQGRSLWRFWRR